MLIALKVILEHCEHALVLVRVVIDVDLRMWECKVWTLLVGLVRVSG